MNSNAPYLSYLQLHKARKKAVNFKRAKFKDRILALTRSKPNPKFGGYFISPKAVEGNDGRSWLSPISIGEFRKIKLQDWDKIYFERGHIYNWLEYEVTTNNNTFSSYGTGADPIFLGSTTLSGATWTSETGGYYSTPLATAPLWVVNTSGEMARQGQSDWIPITASPSDNERTFSSATLNAFNSVETLTTAKARFKEFNFRMSYEYGISAYDGAGTITFDSNVVGGATNLPMVLYGQKQFATLEGDWWYDDANNELWIKTASDPTGLDIRVVTENHAFNINEGTGITISNLEITQYYARGIRTFRATNLDLDNIYIHDIRTNGLGMFGNNTGVIDVGNVTFERCGLNAIFMGAINDSTFHDITINEIGMQDNIGWPIHLEYRKHGGVALSVTDEPTEVSPLPSNITVNDFWAEDLGSAGIAPYGSGWTIERAYVNNFALRFSDVGGIHPFYVQSFGAGGSSNGIIRDCIVHNGIGSHDGIANATGPNFIIGAYIDNGSNNWLIEDCTLFDNEFAGVYANWDTEQTTVTGCLIAGNGVRTGQNGAQIFFLEKNNSTDSPNFQRNKKNVVTNNIMVPPSETQLAIVTISNSTGADANYNPFDNGGSCDNNRYVKIYATQFGSLFGHSTGTNTAAYTTLTFAGWQSRNSVDASSTVMTPYIDYSNVERSEFDIRVLSNPTGASANIAAPSDFQDEDNVDVVSPVSVPAWSGQLVITKASNYYLTDGFNAANGTSLAGRTPTIGPIPTIVAGTHTIQSSNLISSVDGHTRYDLGTPDLIWEMRQSVSLAGNGFTTNFRAQDNTISTNNRITFTMSATAITVNQVVGGVTTLIGTAAHTVTTSTQYVIKVTLNGSNVRVSVNGVELITGSTTLLTGNFHGIFGSTTKTTIYYVAYKLTAV